MTTKQPDFADLNAMAIEACDVWQEHLSTLANDPAARADLTRFLEPQRRLFADWAAMMQQGGSHDFTRAATNPPASAPEPAASASGGAASGDDPLRAAQLALRVAELEKRIAQLERFIAKAFDNEPKSGAPRRTQRETS